jgi:hypothetical protein
MTDIDPSTRYLPIDEATKETGLTPKQIVNMTHNGQLRTRVNRRGVTLYAIADILEGRARLARMKQNRSPLTQEDAVEKEKAAIIARRRLEDYMIERGRRLSGGGL